jgi:hypothetical protein
MSPEERLEMLREKMLAEIQEYAIILLDPEGNILSWNKGVEKTTMERLLVSPS